MKLKLSEWASIAEILGAIAVVISLIFVGLQINEGNRESRASTVQAALDSEMLFQTHILSHTDIWLKIQNGEPLNDEIEIRKAIILYNMNMTLNENRFEQYKSGYLETEPPLESNGIVNWPIYEIWRDSPGARSRSPEFLEYLDLIRSR